MDWHQEAVVRIARGVGDVDSYRDSTSYPPRQQQQEQHDGKPKDPVTSRTSSLLSTKAQKTQQQQQQHYDDRDFGLGNDDTSLTLRIVCTPAQHRSGRGIFDHFKTLWSSWVVQVVKDGETAFEQPSDGDKAGEGGDMVSDKGPTDGDKTSDKNNEKDGFRMFFAG